MFWDTFLGSPQYLVKKDTTGNPSAIYDKPIFASALWMGGIDANGQLHLAAQTYRQNGNDFWPGPLDTINGSIDSIVSLQFDKVWKINRFDIEEFKYHYLQGNVQNGTYLPSADILSWPAHGSGNYSKNLAPFIDVNQNGLYDPIVGGDYPKINGDQMLYWIFNDQLYPHTETNAMPLKVEVHASAYAFSCDTLPDSLKVINNTTFYNYQFINRSSLNYDSLYIGVWNDFQAYEVYPNPISSVPSQNCIVSRSCCKNEITLLPFLSAPLSFTQLFLNGPLADAFDNVDNDNDSVIDETNERSLMNHFICYYNNSNSIAGNPTTPQHYYNYLQSKWKNGTHLTYGGNGQTSGPTTNFFNGDFLSVDTAGWSDEHGAVTRALSSIGPLKFNVQDTIEYEYAFLYNRDFQAIDFNEYYSKTSLLNDYKQIRRCYAAQNFPTCIPMNVGLNKPSKESIQITAYPNPANHEIHIQCLDDILHQSATVSVYNAFGQLCIQKPMTSNNITLPIVDLQAGLFQLVIRMDNGKMAQFKFVHL
jgi:hypothetical protein